MIWPPDLELRWQVFFTSIEATSHGFYLLEYDQPQTRLVLQQRLMQDFTSRGWQLWESEMLSTQLREMIADGEKLIGYKALVVDLDQAGFQDLRSLNLSRESLYNLPTNLIFLASQETHARLLMDAHDLATWFNLPYRFAETPDMTKPSGLPIQKISLSNVMLRRLRQTLLRCGPFDSDRSLRTVFIDTRLSLWRDGLPEALSRIDRVDAVTAYLLEQYNRNGENALILLLRVLSDQCPVGDSCHYQLRALADELSVWTPISEL